MTSRLWLLYAIITTVFWGVWGAFIEIPGKAGFPATLGDSVWALTMIPCALVALKTIGFKLGSVVHQNCCQRPARSIVAAS